MSGNDTGAGGRLIVPYKWLAEHYSDDDIVILDSRGGAGYSYGHIPNSQPLGVDRVVTASPHGAHLVISSSQAAELFGQLGIDESKTVIIYGDYMDPSSARIAWTLLYFGHERTRLLDVGIGTWQKSGLAVTKAVPSPAAATFVPNVNRSIRIESDDLQKRISSAVIIDARSPQEFLSGRIPNAVLLPFTEGVGEGGMAFRAGDDLVKLFGEHQVPQDGEIVCYCALGHRASSLFLQLKMAGYKNVRLYDGSFADWVGRGLPLG